MTNDQMKRLDEVAGKLVEVLILEANPDHWPGAGLTSADMDRDTRGDVYWSKKNASATMGLISRLQSIMRQDFDDRSSGRRPQVPGESSESDEPDSTDRDIAKYEKVAAKKLNDILAAIKDRG